MLKQKTSRLGLYATGLTLLMLIAWWGLDQLLDGTRWRGMTISQSAVTGEYCEFNHTDRFFHQPINTYSNLAYFFFGALILLVARRDYRRLNPIAANRLAAFPLLSVLMGGGFVYLSLGSAFFHASLTYVGQRVDMNATYGILITLVGITFYHLSPRRPLTPARRLYWALAIVATIALFIPLAPRVSSSKLVPGLILLLNAGMLINYVQHRNERLPGLILLSFVLIVVAIIIRTRDVQKVNCDPYAFFQGHALWHVLTALSSFCSYAFFRLAGRRALF